MPASVDARTAALRLNPRAELLRREEGLGIFASLYIDDLSAADLVHWCVRKEHTRNVERGMSTDDAFSAVLLMLAIDPPSVILAALSASDEDETDADLHDRLECLAAMLEALDAKPFGEAS